jgi:hypothetical protein
MKLDIRRHPGARYLQVLVTAGVIKVTGTGSHCNFHRVLWVARARTTSLAKVTCRFFPKRQL